MASPDEVDGVPIDNDVLDAGERPVDRFHHSALGEVTGAAMTGFAKALGWAVDPEEVTVVRDASGAPPNPDDPIDVHIDLDHPENSRIVYRLRPEVD